jgi:hypothetical protein
MRPSYEAQEDWDSYRQLAPGFGRKVAKKTAAQIIINVEHVSLDGPNGKAICSGTGTQRVAEEL